jgi:hypothetical protein
VTTALASQDILAVKESGESGSMGARAARVGLAYDVPISGKTHTTARLIHS